MRPVSLSRLLESRNFLGLLFMLPAAVVLLLFLTYPLGLGTWLGFTDTKIGRGGEWIGLENYEFLWGDAVTRLSVFNTLFYTVVASVIKFVLGLWLALLLNKHLPFKSFIRADRAAALHRADRAVGDRLLVDLRRAVLDHQLDAGQARVDRPLHRFPRRALARAPVGDRRQRLARHALRRDLPAGGPADDLAVVLRGREPRWRHATGSSSAT